TNCSTSPSPFSSCLARTADCRWSTSATRELRPRETCDWHWTCSPLPSRPPRGEHGSLSPVPWPTSRVWLGRTTPEPAFDDYHAQEAGQYDWVVQGLVARFAFSFRADLEARAGGNPSWNTGVNYQKQLKKSVDYAEVLALYAEAGLSLADDL